VFEAKIKIMNVLLPMFLCFQVIKFIRTFPDFSNAIKEAVMKNEVFMENI